MGELRCLNGFETRVLEAAKFFQPLFPVVRPACFESARFDWRAASRDEHVPCEAMLPIYRDTELPMLNAGIESSGIPGYSLVPVLCPGSPLHVSYRRPGILYPGIQGQL